MTEALASTATGGLQSSAAKSDEAKSNDAKSSEVKSSGAKSNQSANRDAQVAPAFGPADDSGSTSASGSVITPILIAARARKTRATVQFIQKLLPFLVFGLALLAWELVVRINNIPHYILPAPTLVAKTLWDNLGSLMVSWLYTMKITFGALLLAVVGGVALAMLFALNKWVELCLFPFAIVLQVTPIVAIAPLILIFIDSTTAALLLCAWIVAFFPILSNTVVGLRSADHNLRDLFTLYRASPWQTLRFLLVPSAMPYFIAGLKIAGGLSLIGAVVAEFTAGAAGKETGLASRILEASFRTEIPKMFAALVLVSLTGIMIYLVFMGVSKLVLGKWHESEIKSSR